MTPAELINAAKNGKAVVSPTGRPAWARRYLPAAFVVNMQFCIVMDSVDRLVIHRKDTRND